MLCLRNIRIYTRTACILQQAQKNPQPLGCGFLISLYENNG
ncbi:MAG: hypothetical protein ACJA0G_001124, partial [Kangiellaceae bacterium]